MIFNWPPLHRHRLSHTSPHTNSARAKALEVRSWLDRRGTDHVRLLQEYCGKSDETIQRSNTACAPGAAVDFCLFLL